MILVRLSAVRVFISTSRNCPRCCARSMMPRVSSSCSRCCGRNSGVVMKTGQVRQALACGQLCCSGKPQ